jgi:hypothetical protein
MDPVRELKIRAEILQTRLDAGDAAALARLRALPELRRAALPALAAMARDLRRKHCLALVARECGFSSWESARRVLEGDPGEIDLGGLLYGRRPGDSGTLHAWFASYDEARAAFDAASALGTRAFLLAHRRQFFLAAAPFIAALGMNPDDPDWEAIGRDWARPADRAARGRLYQRRLAALRGDS